jgi:molybdate transport system ATP-binding protein
MSAQPEQSTERARRRMSLEVFLRQGVFTLEIHEHIDARVVALFGPSGAGKTTVLEAIAGLRTPERGVIRIGARTLFDSSEGVDLPAHERRVGYVPQDLALFPHLNVRRNILYGADAGGWQRLNQVVGMLELDSALDRNVTTLSGGERQRVALARALMASPALLLLDEPLAALDRGLRDRILPYLERIRDELAIPMLYVSHAEMEVRAVADWIVVLDAGRVTRSSGTV